MDFGKAPLWGYSIKKGNDRFIKEVDEFWEKNLSISSIVIPTLFFSSSFLRPFLLQIMVTLVDQPHREVKLKISSMTLARELVQLALKKAGMWDYAGPWTEPYCLLTKELPEQGEG